jgi:hypothetical protein
MRMTFVAISQLGLWLFGEKVVIIMGGAIRVAKGKYEWGKENEDFKR